MLRNGYAVHPGILDAGELDSVVTHLERMALPRSRAGVRHLMNVPVVARIAADPRLLRIAGAWLDDEVVPFRATLFDKSPDANWLVAWHQDTALPIETRRDAPGWGPWSEKAGVLYAHAPGDVLRKVVALRIHIDNSTEDNGPLRVLPGTHELGVMTDAQVQECVQRITGVSCCVDAGGVVVMRPLIVHASSKARRTSPRRVLHVEYISSLTTDQGIRLRLA